MLAYLVHRVGDPDALLQEQRGYMRLNSQQATQIIEYEKQDRAYRNEIRSLRMQLKRLD